MTRTDNEEAGRRAHGGAAVIVAHRQSAFARCEVVFLMDGGRIAAPGRDAARPAGDGTPSRWRAGGRPTAPTDKRE